MTQFETLFPSLTEAEYHYAMLWLNQAEADAIEALASRSRLHSLFWVQQSVEKSVKGLLLLRGKSYASVRRIGHQSLKGDLRIIDGILDDPMIQEVVDDMLKSNSRKQLGELRSRLSSNEIYRLREMSVGDVDLFLSVVPNLRKVRELAIGSQVDGMLTAVWKCKSPSEQMQALREMKSPNSSIDMSPVNQRIIQAFNLCEHHLASVATVPHAEAVIRSGVDNLYKHAETTTQLYLLSAMTFVHAGSCRYPSRPDSLEAEQDDSFGSQDYSDSIGVFKRVGRLGREARTVAAELKALTPLEALPPCGVCADN